MEHGEDLDHQCVAINTLRRFSTEWVIKVLLIHRGSPKPYNTKNGEGVRWPLIFVDEEGIKIQAILFNEDATSWEEIFEQNHTYYIINGRMVEPNHTFMSPHKDLEIRFITNKTDVKSCGTEFNTNPFSERFISLGEAEKLAIGTSFDVVCILTTMKSVTGEGKSRKRDCIVTNERNDRKIITLWADFADITSKMVDTINANKPVVAFCDVKGSTFLGPFSLSTTPTSSIIINPTFQKAAALQQWYDELKGDNKDITLMPSLWMRKAKEVKISDILEGFLSNTKDSYCKFTATLTNITNQNDIWYPACTKCHRRVNVMNDTATCNHCKRDDAEYENRYRLTVTVSAKGESLTITFFDSTRYLLGCDISEYIQSTIEKKEESKYYRKLMLSKDKDFTFLVKNDNKNKEEAKRGNLIVEEVHEVEKYATIVIADEDIPFNRKNKRPKKDEDNMTEKRPLKDIKIKVAKD